MGYIFVLPEFGLVADPVAGLVTTAGISYKPILDQIEELELVADDLVGMLSGEDKKSPASGWPIIQGDYHTGDANSPVAVITMGSHLDEAGICAAGAALAGSCKTENLGIEKIVANIISNPNIRFVLLCGTEVKGHLSGQSIEAMHSNGVEGGKIVGSKGAIPFLENLTAEHIKRFQEQVEIVNIMESEDLGVIGAKINELKSRDPGAFGAGSHCCPNLRRR
ncbi:unnamed protein product [Cylicocyclus nassatus]|uniref:Uncharacterized protein n=1 Tax=Cylicocyclus nassatus TaxID=53992 RepID=A0AA36M7Q6_CYLNA|nr:unnamed protein product [Cylicocyclus nassatus]